MEIAVVGTGYVGLVAAVCFADAGHTVHCVDSDPKKVSQLRDGIVPFYEPGLEELLRLTIKAKRITFDREIAKPLAKCSIVFIAVGTPEKADGSADMTATMNVVGAIANTATSEKVVVMKSTVPVGTAKIIEDYFKKYSDFQHDIVSNPEFLKEGAAIDDFLKPDRVIIGHKTPEAREIMGELYAPFVKNGNPIIFMENVSAELTKYAANTFLATKISFINELAAVADAVGADIEKVRDGFTSDRRINPAFFYPGLGYGGSCFPKDVKSYIHMGLDLGLSMHLSQATDKVNDDQRDRFFKKIMDHYKGQVKGKKFAFWGLSFKPRTDDMREAPSITLIENLTRAGASVVAYDPVAGENAKKMLPSLEVVSTAEGAIQSADALVLATEWNEFRNPDFLLLKKHLKDAVIFDGRNIYNPKTVASFGFKYYCIGRQGLANQPPTILS